MIEIKNVSKSFGLARSRDDLTFKETVVTAMRRLQYRLKYMDVEDLTYPPLLAHDNEADRNHVLKNVSMTIPRGQTLALIGSNGCGKSTLLKLLAGIYFPDSGTVNIDGRVSALIELGAGFHPEFSGRENVYVNGQILGLSKKQIDALYKEIVEFSGLGRYIEMPVRTYSSGMFMRLAFSVAVNVDPDILLIDEILAVGDADFQHKCHKKMDEFKRQGKTIILVTHSLNLVESWTDRAIYLKDGEIQFDGKPQEAISLYLNDVENRNENTEQQKPTPAGIESEAGRLNFEYKYHDPCLSRYSVRHESGNKVVCTVGFNVGVFQTGSLGFRVTNKDSTVVIFEDWKDFDEPAAGCLYVLRIDLSALNSGDYVCSVFVNSGDRLNAEVLSWHEAVSIERTSLGFVSLPLEMVCE